MINLGTGFIENESEDVEKQDCEINAAKRLMELIKKEYLRMPICIQGGDTLYVVKPIMKACRGNGWEYLFTQKDTKQPLVGEGFEWIRGRGRNNKSEKCQKRAWERLLCKPCGKSGGKRRNHERLRVILTILFFNAVNVNSQWIIKKVW